MAEKSTERDLLVRLDTQNQEILRRMDSIDKHLVPRNEYTSVVEEMRRKHASHEKEIKEVQFQMRGLTWKLAGAVATVQVILTLVIYLLTRGV